MPYYCHVNRELYVEKINAMLTELNEMKHTCFSVPGDWNANVISDDLSFGPNMIEFCNENNLIISSQELLEMDSFSNL